MIRFTVIFAAGVMLTACEQQSAAPAGEANNAATAREPGGTKPSSTPVSEEVPLSTAAADPALKWGPCPEGMPQGCGIAILHGDPAKPNADIFLRVPGGAVIPPHAHSSAERMILVSGEMEVKYLGARAAMLRSGHYAYGPAKLPHQATCRSSEQCTLFIAFEGPVDVLPFTGSRD